MSHKGKQVWKKGSNSKVCSYSSHSETKRDITREITINKNKTIIQGN